MVTVELAWRVDPSQAPTAVCGITATGVIPLRSHGRAPSSRGLFAPIINVRSRGQAENVTSKLSVELDCGT